MKKAHVILLVGVMGWATTVSAFAADKHEKADYDAAQKTAAANYKTMRAKCEGLKGNSKDVCVAEAKATRTRAEAQAKANYEHTDKAQAKARKDIADADYDVAKAKCDALKDNPKDVCMKEAKAAKVAADADAKANQEKAEASKEARDEKRDAEYKVALEKCDGLKGASKDGCVANAKMKFDK